MSNDCSGCPLDGFDLDPHTEPEESNFHRAIDHARAVAIAIDLRRDSPAPDPDGKLLTAVQLIEEAIIRLRRAHEISKEVPYNE